MTCAAISHWTLGLLVLGKRPLVHIDSQTSVSDALALLQRENILSAPIWDADKQQYIGLASISDLVSFVAFGCFQPEHLDSPDALQAFRAIDQPASTWVLGLEQSATPLLVLPAATTIAATLPLLSDGVHHQALVQLEDGSYNIVSQIDILRFIGAFASRLRHATWSNQPNDKSFPDLLFMRIQDVEGLVVGADNIVTIPKTATALEAFRTLDRNQLRAAPVVEADGTVITTISVSDMRGLRSSNLNAVKRSVLGFLQTHRGDFHLSHTVHQADAIHTALLQFTSWSVHRLWIVDDANQIQGALSMTDLIREFAVALA